jgi:GNAT superfamily N-acetyltransferase
MTQIRAMQQHDMAALKGVIDSSELFPSELLNDMTAEYFATPATNEIWLVAEQESTPIAVAYCAPERLTDGTYNLYLIAVHRQFQGTGIGAEIMRYVEQMLIDKGARILLVETSGLPEFERTRAFYDKCSYTREAVIRDFYKAGDDKVVFWKQLSNNMISR